MMVQDVSGGAGEAGMIDAFRLGTIYRSVYGHVRNRVERLGINEHSDDLVIDPLEAAGPLALAHMMDPQVLDVIREAIADARAGRRPRW
jgi:hypothetical protein